MHKTERFARFQRVKQSPYVMPILTVLQWFNCLLMPFRFTNRKVKLLDHSGLTDLMLDAKPGYVAFSRVRSVDDITLQTGAGFAKCLVSYRGVPQIKQEIFEERLQSHSWPETSDRKHSLTMNFPSRARCKTKPNALCNCVRWHELQKLWYNKNKWQGKELPVLKRKTHNRGSKETNSFKGPSGRKRPKLKQEPKRPNLEEKKVRIVNRSKLLKKESEIICPLPITVKSWWDLGLSWNLRLFIEPNWSLTITRKCTMFKGYQYEIDFEPTAYSTIKCIECINHDLSHTWSLILWNINQKIFLPWCGSLRLTFVRFLRAPWQNSPKNKSHVDVVWPFYPPNQVKTSQTICIG